MSAGGRRLEVAFRVAAPMPGELLSGWLPSRRANDALGSSAAGARSGSGDGHRRRAASRADGSVCWTGETVKLEQIVLGDEFVSTVCGEFAPASRPAAEPGCSRDDAGRRRGSFSASAASPPPSSFAVQPARPPRGPRCRHLRALDAGAPAGVETASRRRATPPVRRLPARAHRFPLGWRSRRLERSNEPSSRRRAGRRRPSRTHPRAAHPGEPTRPIPSSSTPMSRGAPHFGHLDRTRGRLCRLHSAPRV